MKKSCWEEAGLLKFKLLFVYDGKYKGTAVKPCLKTSRGTFKFIEETESGISVL